MSPLVFKRIKCRSLKICFEFGGERKNPKSKFHMCSVEIMAARRE